MDANKVDMFFATNGKKLPANKIAVIRDKMSSLDDSRYATIASVEMKDPTIALILSILLGELGIDRFFIGHTGMGLLKLFTMGLCGILWLIDIFTISGKVKERNYQELMTIL